jgi:ferredoxin
MTTQKKRMLAVHDDDLADVLYKLGVRHDFEAGKLKCSFCRQVVDY